MKDIIKTYFLWIAVGAGVQAGIELSKEFTPKFINKFKKN